MIKSENFANVMTSELLLKQESELEQEKCKEELSRRLRSIGFTDAQIEKFIIGEQAVIDDSKSNTLSEKLMAKMEFFDIYNPHSVEVEKLTISEMLIATEEATNAYPCAIGGEGGPRYFEVISDFARQTFKKGYNTAVEKLQAIGVGEDTIKKFIFAEWQVILRVTFGSKDSKDAWGDPEKFLS